MPNPRTIPRVWLSAVIFVIPGAILAFNVGHIADRLADNSRALPRWLKGPGSGERLIYRFFGAVFIALAALSGYEAFTGR